MMSDSVMSKERPASPASLKQKRLSNGTSETKHRDSGANNVENTTDSKSETESNNVESDTSSDRLVEKNSQCNGTLEKEDTKEKIKVQEKSDNVQNENVKEKEAGREVEEETGREVEEEKMDVAQNGNEADLSNGISEPEKEGEYDDIRGEHDSDSKDMSKDQMDCDNSNNEDGSSNCSSALYNEEKGGAKDSQEGQCVQVSENSDSEKEEESSEEKPNEIKSKKDGENKLAVESDEKKSDDSLEFCEKEKEDKIQNSGKGSEKIEKVATGNREKEGMNDDKSDREKEDRNDDKPGKFKRHDSDDIQIVGESKLISVSLPNMVGAPSQNVVFVPAGMSNSFSTVTSFPLINQGFAATNVMASSFPSSQWVSASMVGAGGRFVQQSAGSKPTVMMAPAVAPPQPKSSLDQIELIRWEIHNRINNRPKYFKPNNSAELGPLSKFLFDIGSDLIKETVYHELVKIQSKKGEDDKLSVKEKDDLEKLKEIEKDLHATVGHLKVKMKKRCKRCNFQTESTNVMFLHKQYPHEEEKKLHCSHCNFVSKQPMAYKFHIEAEHGMQPRVYDRKAFYECDLCPYENNQEQKLVTHKQRCAKQFRPLFNLHPSCLAGAEINLCLENIFYKPAINRNLKLLQQKHAQQQAALMEAKRQQAQVQALAAQKNAAAAAAKRQQQLLLQQQQQMRAAAYIAPRLSVPQGMTAGKIAPVTKMAVPLIRAKNSRTTVANYNTLNNKQNIPLPQQSTPGFEVCEICGGYVKDRKALRIHFFYAHRIDLPFNLFERAQAPLYCATCYVRFWTAQGLRKHIDTHKEENMTQGVVGKCISCGHHVLNLLIHMRIVHNREIQHYINALMCMFCGSHFSSRHEVERHIRLVHGIVDPLTGTVKQSPAGLPHPSPGQSNKGSAKKSSAGGNAVKGSVCVLCNLNFGRNVDLTRHCMRMHHTCMKCGMVVIDKASLLKHICLSSPSGTRDCSMCSEKGFHPAYYVKHLRDKHLKKFSVRVGRLSKAAVEKWTKRPYPFKEPADVCVEISDSDDDVPLKNIKYSNVSPSKKLKIGPAFFMKKQSPTVKEVINLDDDEESEKEKKKVGKTKTSVVEKKTKHTDEKETEETEQTVEKKTEQTVEKETEQTVEKETEQTVEKETEQTVEKETEQTVEKETEQTVEKSDENVETVENSEKAPSGENNDKIVSRKRRKSSEGHSGSKKAPKC